MNRIIAKRLLSEDVYRIEVEAANIARERKAGQFVIVQADTDWGERIPLTIADADGAKGSISLVFQAVGASTHKLALKEPGDEIAVLGPLGNPTHIENFGHAVCVGGGIGVAPLYPIVQALKDAGNRLTVIMGARTKSLLIMEEEMRALADDLIVVTDDGSYGRKALVTEPLKEALLAGPQARPCRGHRSAHHDEVLRGDDKALRRAHGRVPQHHHDRRNRDVRRLPRLR